MSTNPYESPRESSHSAASRSTKDCPNCGTPMEEGYLLMNGAYWRRWTQWAFILNPFAVLPGTMTLFGVRRKLGARRCTGCQLVQFHYGRRITGRPEPPGPFD